MSKKFTNQEFIEKASKIHNNFYDYSETNYVNSRTKIKIICPIHGVFEQLPNSHMQKNGCPLCGQEKSKKSYFVAKTTSQFISEAKTIHNNFYDYSLVDYKNNLDKIKIICPIHGVFEQMPFNHLSGRGCIKCRNDNFSLNRAKTTSQFISEAKTIHNNFYDYSETNYVNAYIKIKIICPIHGVFEQMPYTHLRGQGCPKCKNSSGENKISNFLTENNVEFISQKKFSDLVDIRKLSFDFYIPSKNLLIEYNGIQHYQSIELFGGEKQLHLQRHHDWLKRKYAKKNGFELLVIKFDEDIENKLKLIL